MRICKIEVHGLDLNDHTGCVHHRKPVDIIAIKFKCCGRYYACHACHRELEPHPVQRWTPDDFDSKAILCGKCEHEQTIHDYLACSTHCPNCKAAFNPGCKKHWYLYFSGLQELLLECP
ncbi:MAG TPA: CHY zinc finger protein [Rhabdochlamydiaceae bacterium]